jgi:hypothetical protein
MVVVKRLDQRGGNACGKSFKSSEKGVAASELASDMRPDASKCAIQGRGASEPSCKPLTTRRDLMATFRRFKRPSIVIIESSRPVGWSSYEDTSSLGSCIINPISAVQTRPAMAVEKRHWPCKWPLLLVYKSPLVHSS